MPVPVNCTTCGLLASESTMVSRPFAVPTTLGVKLTVTVQLPLAAKDFPQVFVCE
jgi:hypothetical protein